MARNQCRSTRWSDISKQTTVHPLGVGRQLGSEPYIPGPAPGAGIRDDRYRTSDRTRNLRAFNTRCDCFYFAGEASAAIQRNIRSLFTLA